MCSHQRRLVPPRPHPKHIRKPGSNHKGDSLQKWSVIDMRNALILYFMQKAPGYRGKKYGYKAIADAYSIPRETFRRRLSGPNQGFFGHLAGGHGNTQVINMVHPTLLVTPIDFKLPVTFPNPITLAPVTSSLSVVTAATPAPAPVPATASVPAPAPDLAAPDDGKQMSIFCFISGLDVM